MSMNTFIHLLRLKRKTLIWIGLGLFVLFVIKPTIVFKPSIHWVWSSMDSRDRLKFVISTSWDGLPVNHRGVELVLYDDDRGLGIEVDAPFFNDPSNPGGKPGHPYQGLWDYEVVETFFLNKENQYLEVELCPHGQHLVLLLSDYRKPFKDMLNLTFSSSISGDSWKGKAVIPWDYFPPKVEKFNAYAIHGSGKERVYESLFPVPHGKFSSPDFHRLDYFQNVAFDSVLPESVETGHLSKQWQKL